MTTLYIIFLSSVLFLKLFKKKNSGITLCRGRLSQKIYDSHSSYFSFAGYIKFNWETMREFSKMAKVQNKCINSIAFVKQNRNHLEYYG